jgi:hypothetical protein
LKRCHQTALCRAIFEREEVEVEGKEEKGVDEMMQVEIEMMHAIHGEAKSVAAASYLAQDAATSTGTEAAGPSSSWSRDASNKPPTKSAAGGMPIIFVTAEVSPWSKTGGLGDVCGALPAALAARGHSVGDLLQFPFGLNPEP